MTFTRAGVLCRRELRDRATGPESSMSTPIRCKSDDSNSIRGGRITRNSRIPRIPTRYVRLLACGDARSWFDYRFQPGRNTLNNKKTHKKTRTHSSLCGWNVGLLRSNATWNMKCYIRIRSAGECFMSNINNSAHVNTRQNLPMAGGQNDVHTHSIWHARYASFFRMKF